MFYDLTLTYDQPIVMNFTSTNYPARKQGGFFFLCIEKFGTSNVEHAAFFKLSVLKRLSVT